MTLLDKINQINSVDILKEEDKAMFVIGNWLHEHGMESYFDKRKDIDDLKTRYPDIRWEFETFKGKGTRKKPDIIFSSNLGHVLLELKHAKKGKNVREFKQTLDYYKICSTGKDPRTQEEAYWTIKDERIRPNYILAASGSSPFGHVHANDGLVLGMPDDNIHKIVRREDHWKEKEDLVLQRTLPGREFIRTYDFVRYLWSFMKTVEDIRIPDYNIGVLVSDILMEKTDEDIVAKQIGKPAAFYQRYTPEGRTFSDFSVIGKEFVSLW
jgi:hypothetical protein